MVIHSHSVVIHCRSILKKINSCILLILFCLLIIPSGCNNQDIIEEDKMVLIYTDLLIAQDTTSSNIDTESLRTSVLRNHNVTEDEYTRTIEYYNEDIERWEIFFDKVTAHLESFSKSPSKE